MLKDRAGATVFVYGRPVYYHDFGHGLFDFFVYGGRRWYLSVTYSWSFTDQPGYQFAGTTSFDVADFLVERHFNSAVAANTFGWLAEYVSEPTGGGSPAGLAWFKWASKSGSGIGTLEPMDTSLKSADCTASLAISKTTNAIYCEGAGSECAANAAGALRCRCQPGYYANDCTMAPAQGLYDIILDNDDGTPCGVCRGQSIIASYADTLNEMGFTVGGCQSLPPTDPLWVSDSSTASGARAMRLGVVVDHDKLELHAVSDDERILQFLIPTSTDDFMEGRSELCDTSAGTQLVATIPLADGAVVAMGHVVELKATGASVVSSGDLHSACPSLRALGTETCLNALGATTQASPPLRAFVSFDLELGQKYTASPSSSAEDDRPNGPWV